MPKTSKESASQIVDHGPAVDRIEHLGDYTTNFVSIRETTDLAPMLKGLPGDSCQCPHWGYMLKGRMTVRYADHSEVLEPGDAFYMSPGHVPSAEADTEFVQFSPTDELQLTEAAMQENMKKMMQLGK